MAKLFEISKKYEVELDIAEAHTIEQALMQYGRDLDKQEIEEYIQEKKSMKTREEMLQEYLRQFEEDSYNIVINPDGSTIKIPVKNGKDGEKV
jgi:hypothetical protein